MAAAQSFLFLDKLFLTTQDAFSSAVSKSAYSGVKDVYPSFSFFMMRFNQGIYGRQRSVLLRAGYLN